jgi:hypothetical protein
MQALYQLSYSPVRAVILAIGRGRSKASRMHFELLYYS